MNKVILNVLITGLFLALGCESIFNPLKENDKLVFSMYGVLDVHADTQWVRVMPVGTSLFPTDPRPNETEVQLIRESTGDISMMKDSLFRFGTDVYVWNYWTTDSIHTNEIYTIVAKKPDGAQSSVTLETPSALPLPEVDYSLDTERITVRGFETDSLVVLETQYLVQPITEVGCGPETEVEISHMEQVIMRPNGEFILMAENRTAIARELGVFGIIVNRRAFVVITATEDWPNGEVLDERELTLPDAVSNVENGTGVVAGIARREIVITPRSPPCEA